jgi:hypothetical protein
MSPDAIMTDNKSLLRTIQRSVRSVLIWPFPFTHISDSSLMAEGKVPVARLVDVLHFLVLWVQAQHRAESWRS